MSAEGSQNRIAIDRHNPLKNYHVLGNYILKLKVCMTQNRLQVPPRVSKSTAVLKEEEEGPKPSQGKESWTIRQFSGTLGHGVSCLQL